MHYLPGIHAALWDDTAASFTDLNPEGHHYSEIHGMAPGVQVGRAIQIGGGTRAAVWNSTAQSWQDFHPWPDTGGSWLRATTGDIHVGELGTGYGHATVWLGSPQNYVDLHQFLPGGYFADSEARAVFRDGNTLYVGGWALNSSTSMPEAWMWIGTIPAPGPALLLGLAGVVAARRRR